MKWSVFTVAVPDLSVEQVIPAAAEAGLHGIEWRCAPGPAEATSQPPSFWGNNLCTIEPGTAPEVLQGLRGQMREHGLDSAAVMPYLKVGDVETAEEVMRIAQALGAPMMRIGVHGYNRSRPYSELYDEQMEYVAKLVPLLKQYGIRGLIETHHMTIAPSASAAYRIASSFDPEHIGVLFDPGNMVFEGYENHRMGLEMLGPYLAHVHVKNADVAAVRENNGPKLEWSPLERGFVRWQQVMEDLTAVGYDGYCGVEDFSGIHSSGDMLRGFVSLMKELAHGAAARQEAGSAGGSSR